MKYDKLVRDYIPYRLQQVNKKYTIRSVGSEEKLQYLYKKVLEETEELKENPGIEELADLYEVLETIRIELKISKKELECKRLRKKNENGGFKKNIVLLEVED